MCKESYVFNCVLSTFGLLWLLGFDDKLNGEKKVQEILEVTRHDH